MPIETLPIVFVKIPLTSHGLVTAHQDTGAFTYLTVEGFKTQLFACVSPAIKFLEAAQDAGVIASLATPVDLESSRRFYTRARPPGFWGPVARSLGEDPRQVRFFGRGRFIRPLAGHGIQTRGGDDGEQNEGGGDTFEQGGSSSNDYPPGA